LDSCSNGDTVLVAKGTYSENLNWPNTLGIALLSEAGPDSTQIDGQAAGSVITITTTLSLATLISGFTIANGGAPRGGGVSCSNCAPTIQNNVITNNRATSSGGGVYCDNASPTVRSNIISWNSAGAGAGLYCYSSSPTIVGNAIERNEGASEGGAVCCFSASSPLIDSNTILSNTAARGAGVYCYYSSAPTIWHNSIVGNNAYGVYVDISCGNADARYNWWGDSTGPYSPDSNPNGQGDWVSDRVDLDPWLLQPGLEESAPSFPCEFPGLSVQPNPARQSVFISLSSGVSHASLTICDASGRVVRVLPLEGGHPLAVSTRGVPPGVYLLEAASSDRRCRGKVLITR